MMDQFEKVELFKARLQESDNDFICATPLPATSATILFLGPFQGNVILWNMTLSTRQYLTKTEDKEEAIRKPEISSQSFIEIAIGKEGVYPLLVGLDVAVIDSAVIKKVIIMMHNYKRLAIGRIEFGSKKS